ncbi:Phosphoadenylyl-sulfate reductase [thioredoxin] [hydrothermal vent metagenome]|uniref:Phosphoadenylyl-sulfate reductase [thioredoxin] n=1 Tax=hydrothermal vent metagenome TaxID=652676 RepID=A0A3B0THT1_9ZZZZ
MMTRTLPAPSPGVEDLVAVYGDHSAGDLLAAMIEKVFGDKIALVSSFGAESAVLLHMISQIDRNAPVVFLDTGKLFAETGKYQQDLSARLGLTNVLIMRPDPIHEADFDPDMDLAKTNASVCCFFRKTVPLRKALRGYWAWITGRKAYQAETRARLPRFERDGRHIKVNPLANWTAADVAAYMDTHNLPAHPLVAKGYPSIGCIDCTTPVAPGEDARAGRWRGQEQTECGIHFADGKPVRAGAA